MKLNSVIQWDIITKIYFKPPIKYFTTQPIKHFTTQPIKIQRMWKLLLLSFVLIACATQSKILQQLVKIYHKADADQMAEAAAFVEQTIIPEMKGYIRKNAEREFIFDFNRLFRDYTYLREKVTKKLVSLGLKVEDIVNQHKYYGYNIQEPTKIKISIP